MIKQGAKLVQDWNDVVVELPPEERRELVHRSQLRLFGEAGGGPDETRGPSSASYSAEASHNPVVRKVLDSLKIETATHIDALLASIEDVTSSEIIAALFELEMSGTVKQLPGRNFVKVW